MKGNKIDVEELTRRFNSYRLEHPKDAYTHEQLMLILGDMGFNKNISKCLTKFFVSQKIGKAKLFSFSNAPVYTKQIEGLYEKARNYNNSYVKKLKKATKEIPDELTDVEKALQLLSSKGYQIRKPRFDIKRFAKEQPGMYAKYLVYDTL
jgi:hypothetical protein